MSTESRSTRCGLPRTIGGPPWPPISSQPQHSPAVTPPLPEASSPVSAPPLRIGLRSGLPRVSNGSPWPIQHASIQPTVIEHQGPPQIIEQHHQPAQAEPAAAPLQALGAQHQVAEASQLPAPTTAAPRARPHWLLMGAGLLGAAAVLILAARGLTTLPGVPEFIARYPGTYPLPDSVQEGFPTWARWTHFLNFFFMALVVRSGLIIRRQRTPQAFYTPRRGGKKVSLYLWLHTSLDVLWFANGIVFVTLLFTSGHWARIVPTSWEVFPNAASSLLQYLTLEWPSENGWVNYNGLQQLMYFVVVFIAAPLAALSGVRMSEWWPRGDIALNRFYPAQLARAIHFPTMLFFIAFVIVHVFLVLTTGMLGNLNHMFAGTDDVSWVGFWWFTAGLAATAGAVALAKPLLLAPIAGLTGKVTNR